MKLKNKIVIVTGASSGIGEGIAKRFVEEGATVYGCALEESADLVLDGFIYESVDVTDFAQCDAFVKKVFEKAGNIHILVNSAGIMISGNIEDVSCEDFNLQFDVNVNGTFNMCKATIEYLKRGNSSIINLASSLGARPSPNNIAYNASKAAVISMTECLAIDYAPNVRANSILPGMIDTPMTKPIFEKDETSSLRKFYEGLYMAKRLGTVDDVVNSAVFLASDESSFITAESLGVCSGRLIK